jgi:hypothetical protein
MVADVQWMGGQGGLILRSGPKGRVSKDGKASWFETRRCVALHRHGRA